MPKKLLTILALLASLFLVACQAPTQAPTQSQGQTQAAPKSGGTLIMMQSADVISWDYTATTWPSMKNVDPLFDTLLTMDENENLLPNLVEAWEISDDGLEYTFHLRSGVTFHDGTPFNADAVIFNVQRHIDNLDSRSNVEMSNVVEMEAIDDLTVKLVIGEPNGDFIYAIGVDTGSNQLSPTAWGEDGAGFAEHPVGTGPFKFQSYEPQSEIQYVRNDEYWKGAPLLDGITIRIHADSIVRLIELESGNVDYIDNFTGDDASRLQAETDMVINAPAAPGVVFVSLNVSRPPMTELAVRQAIAHAIDFDAIINDVLFGFPVRSRGGVSPNSPYYTEDLPEQLAYDPVRAGELLDAAGWLLEDDGFRYRDGEKLVINIISTDFLEWGLYNEIYQQALTEIGIDAQLKSMEWNAMLDEWRENQGDWHMGHHAQGSVLAVSSAIQAAWKPNDFWSINQIDDATEPYLVEIAAELQTIGDEFSATVDIEERAKLSQRAQTLFLEQQLSVWGWHEPSYIANNPRVKGLYWIYGGRIPQFDKAWIEE